MLLKIKYLVSVIQSKNYNTKINETEKNITDHNHDKYITTPEFNNLTSKKLVNKTDFDGKLKNVNKKITSNKTKHILIENELKKLQTFNSSLFLGQRYFNNHGTQLYVIFQPM